MTEQEFDRKVEGIATWFELLMEASADRLEKGLTHAWNKSWIFRFISRSISLTAEIALLIGAKRLAERNHKTAAMWCAGLALFGLIADFIRIIVLRRK